MEWKKEVLMVSDWVNALKTNGDSLNLDHLTWEALFKSIFLRHFKILNANQLKISTTIVEILSYEDSAQKIFDQYIEFTKQHKEPINSHEIFNRITCILNKGALPQKEDIIQISYFIAKKCKTNENLLLGLLTLEQMIDVFRKKQN